MSARTWTDAQRRAIETRGQNLLVSAGAGSGKTTVLVERIMRLVLEEGGVDLNRLLIVTFTEAAAREMRERIGHALRAQRERVDISNKRFMAHLARQAGLLEIAQISTLHSFCMNVIRRNFLCLGLDPGFRMMAEDERFIVRRRLVERLLEAALEEDEDGNFARMLDAFGVVDALDIVPLVFRLDEFAQSQPHPDEWLRAVQCAYGDVNATAWSELAWTEWYYRWLDRLLDEAMSVFAQGERLSNGLDELASYHEALVHLAECTQSARMAVQEVRPLSEVNLLVSAALSGKRVAAKAHPMKEEVVNLRTGGLSVLKTIRAATERTEDEYRGDLVALADPIAQLVQFVLQFQSAFADEKRTANVLDFGDLEHFALKALMDPDTHEALRLREQFVEIFVDEYQDTSPIQESIIRLMGRPNGNVFVVGDVKQSIYRFRMAEPTIFVDTYQTMLQSGQGTVISLAANYRSREPVVSAVNYVFGRLFSRRFGGVDYDDAARMQAGAMYPKTSDPHVLEGPVEVHLVERQNDTESNLSGDSLNQPTTADEMDESATGRSESNVDSENDADSIELETAAMVERIEEWMGKGRVSERAQVWDKELGTYRPLRYRDIVILLRSVKGRMNRVLDVLRQHGIPAYGATSSGFFDALEIQWMMACLATIQLPRIDKPLITFLRSPLTGFSDEELARIRLASQGSFIEALQKVATGTGPFQARCREVVQRIQRWRSLARRTSTVNLLQTVIRETDILDFVLGMSGGPIRKANIQLLLDKAAQFDAIGYEGAFGFERWLEEMTDLQLDQGEARTLGEQEDVVRVMTIHQSKGLEFPLVFLADLGKQFYESPVEQAVPLHRHLGFGPKRLSMATGERWPTLATIAIQEANALEFKSEEARVLYVAMTRARDKLVMVGSVRGLESQINRSVRHSRIAKDSLPLSTLLGAKTYLDWLLPLWLSHPDGQPLRNVLDDASSTIRMSDDGSRFSIHLWNLPGNRIPVGSTVGHPSPAAMDDEALANFETIAASQEGVSVLSKGRAMEIPSKVSATDLRRLWVAKVDPQAVQTPTRAAGQLLRVPNFVTEVPGSDGNGSAVETTVGKDLGTAFHAVMRHISLDEVRQGIAVSRLLEDLVIQGRIRSEDAAVVSEEDVSRFFETAIGQRLLGAHHVYREQPFFCRLPVPRRFDTGPIASEPFVIAQGVIDVLGEDDSGFFVVDYKTDRVNAAMVHQKAEEYRAQVGTYLMAVSNLVPRSRLEGYLYFVHCQTLVSMQSVDLGNLWN